MLGQSQGTTHAGKCLCLPPVSFYHLAPPHLLSLYCFHFQNTSLCSSSPSSFHQRAADLPWGSRGWLSVLVSQSSRLSPALSSKFVDWAGLPAHSPSKAEVSWGFWAVHLYSMLTRSHAGSVPAASIDPRFCPSWPLRCCQGAVDTRDAPLAEKLLAACLWPGLELA